MFVGDQFKTIGLLEQVLGTDINNEYYLPLRNTFNYFKLSHRKELALTIDLVLVKYYCSIIKKNGRLFT
jgi:hypothetical protein